MNWQQQLTNLWQNSAPYLQEIETWTKGINIEHFIAGVAVLIFLQGFRISRSLRAERRCVKELERHIRNLKSITSDAAAVPEAYQYTAQRHRRPTTEEALKVYRQEASA